MNHLSKISVEVTARTPTGSATEEQLKHVTDEVLEALMHESMYRALGREYDDSTGSLHYTIKVLQNEFEEEEIKNESKDNQDSAE